MYRGRKLTSSSQQTPLSFAVHVRRPSPLRPWTATMLPGAQLVRISNIYKKNLLYLRFSIFWPVQLYESRSGHFLRRHCAWLYRRGRRLYRSGGKKNVSEMERRISGGWGYLRSRGSLNCWGLCCDAEEQGCRVWTLVGSGDFLWSQLKQLHQARYPWSGRLSGVSPSTQSLGSLTSNLRE